jgi:hypothetical protein
MRPPLYGTARQRNMGGSYYYGDPDLACSLGAMNFEAGFPGKDVFT